MKVNMHEAKSQLSRLGRLAWEGEEIVIAKAGEPWLLKLVQELDDIARPQQMGGIVQLRK